VRCSVAVSFSVVSTVCVPGSYWAAHWEVSRRGPSALRGSAVDTDLP
jgi:hypothetical protein